MHSLHGSNNTGLYNGFAALSKAIGTSKATEKDSDYIREQEHSVLKYLRNKIAHYLHNYFRHWFTCFGLPQPNGEHTHLRDSHIQQLMRHVQRPISTTMVDQVATGLSFKSSAALI